MMVMISVSERGCGRGHAGWEAEGRVGYAAHILSRVWFHNVWLHVSGRACDIWRARENVSRRSADSVKEREG